jgi:hypothetical protein
MAALSVLNKKNVREIEIRKLQQSLLDAGAWLMPLFDVSAEDKDFQSIQRIAACGILKVKGESHNWANRTWFYPDSTLIIREMLEGLNAFDQKITVENDSSRLTVQKAAEFLSRLLNKNVLSEVQGILGTGMKGKLDIQSTITKREIAVLIDRLIHPFETKSIGFDGNYR